MIILRKSPAWRRWCLGVTVLLCAAGATPLTRAETIDVNAQLPADAPPAHCQAVAMYFHLSDRALIAVARKAVPLDESWAGRDGNNLLEKAHQVD